MSIDLLTLKQVFVQNNILGSIKSSITTLLSQRILFVHVQLHSCQV